MNIYAKDIIFDGKTTIDYGVRLCNFGSSGLENGNGISIDLKTVNVGDKWHITNGKYASAIQFTIQMCKDNFEEISTWELASISRWFFRNDNKYYFLQFVQEDYEQILLKVKSTSFKPISIGGVVVGIEITYVSDSTHGYSREYSDIYNLGFTITHFDFSDEVGCLYPNLEIVINEDCTVKLYNSLTEATTEITGCKAGEIITYNAFTNGWTSSLSTHNVVNCYNFVPFAFANTLTTRKNIITMTGVGTVRFTYRLLKKVGV